MRGHNICFYSEIRKIIFELSPIPLLSGALVRVSFVTGGLVRLIIWVNPFVVLGVSGEYFHFFYFQLKFLQKTA